MTAPASNGVPEAVVMDASALLAMVHAEPGGQGVERALPNAFMSSVNWSEVIQKAFARSLPVEGRRQSLEALGLSIVTFTPEDAETAASIWRRAPHLSLGDRACLALAQRLGLPALTADRIWQGLSIDVEIRLIR